MKLFSCAGLIGICLSLAGPGLAQDCDQLTPYRTIDGRCNNLLQPTAGAAGNFYARFAEGAEYADGIAMPVTDRPNARTISNAVADSADPPVLNGQGISLFEVFFGQFLNHDLEHNRLTGTATSGFTIRVDLLDPYDDLFTQTGKNFIVLRPSAGDATVTGQFEVFNDASSWIDLDTIYGRKEEDAGKLRTHSGGRLLTSDYVVQIAPTGVSGNTVTLRDLPPKQAMTGLPTEQVFVPNAFFGPPLPVDQVTFTSGDERVGENAGLSLMHTLWIREHNRIAAELAAEHPNWDDERLYQESRRLTIAIYQHIIYDEYLPTLLGPTIAHAPEWRYRGYQPAINPDTSMVFATAAFRYGHSATVPYDLLQCTGAPYQFQFSPTPGVLVTTQQLPAVGQNGGPFNPPFMLALGGGEENILRGLLAKTGGAVDTQYVDDIRNIVIQGGFGAGVDLMVSDIMRGRLNGVPNYAILRQVYFGRPPVQSDIYQHPSCAAAPDSPSPDPLGCFLRITSNATLAQALQTLYGKVNQIDGIVGLLAEDPLPNSELPRTMARIIADNYYRKRAGDRFYYEQSGLFTATELAYIKSRSFRDVVEDNSAVLDANPNVFLAGGQFECPQ